MVWRWIEEEFLEEELCGVRAMRGRKGGLPNAFVQLCNESESPSRLETSRSEANRRERREGKGGERRKGRSEYSLDFDSSTSFVWLQSSVSLLV